MGRLGKWNEHRIVFDDGAGHRHRGTGGLGSRLGTGAIPTVALGASVVRGTSLIDASVPLRKMAASAVDATVILDSGIDRRNLRASIVDGTVMMDAVIDKRHFLASVVDATVIGDAVVDLRNMRASAVDATVLVDAGVDLRNMRASAVDPTVIIDGGVVARNAGRGLFTIAEQATAMMRLWLIHNTVVAATTGNTVQFGGATGYFTTHIDGWLVDDHERTSATAVVAGTAASTIFTLLAGSVAVNTVRVLLWGR